MPVVTLWNSLCNQVNIADPIFRWSIFQTENDIRHYISRIGNALSTCQFAHIRNNAIQKNAFSSLFLVRCVLITRLCNDWELVIRDEFIQGIGQNNFDGNTWRECIGVAEKCLGRSSLLPFHTEGKSRRYCARILVEAGIPLGSLAVDAADNGIRFSKVVYGLRNIWDLRSSTSSVTAYEQCVNDFLAGDELLDPEGNSFWLPGGHAGCRKFFGMGLEFLEKVDAVKRQDGRSYDQIISNDYGLATSTDVVNEIFGLGQGLQTTRSRSIIKIKRLLHWEDEEYYTQLRVEYEPTGVMPYPEYNQVILKNSDTEIRRWSYDIGNHNINEPPETETYESDVVSAISAHLQGPYNDKELEVLNQLDLTQPVIFKSNGSGEFEEVEAPNERDFPLCVIIPENYAQTENLDLTSVESSELVMNNDSVVCQVYKFENPAMFANSGLSLSNVNLVLEKPSQTFAVAVESNGRTYRNPKTCMGIPRAPLRMWSSEVVYKGMQSTTWEELHNLRLTDFLFGNFKLTTSAQNDRGSTIVVLPSGFAYEYTRDAQNRVNGIRLLVGGRHTIPCTTMIDNASATPEAWQNITSDSVIQCRVRNSAAEILVLTIPSPAVGVSWFYQDEPHRLSVYDYKTAVQLNCVRNSMVENSCYFHVRLVDGEKTLLEFDDYIENESCEESSVEEHHYPLPSYIERLFSATNSLRAKIEVTGCASFGGSIVQTSPIEITRFDENPYEGPFFCFGLLSVKVLAQGTLPTDDECSVDMWVKVPASQSGNGTWCWNGRNRIYLLGNEVTDFSGLNSFQKMLVGNNFVQVQNKVRNYFASHRNTLDDEVKKIILDYFNLCQTYSIPVCNLWLLQFVLQDDQILVQVPGISTYKHLLDENSSKCSFDWQLLRHSVLEQVQDAEMKALLAREVSLAGRTETALSDSSICNFDYPQLPSADDDEDDVSFDSYEIREEYRSLTHDTNPSQWDLVLYFIVSRVIYGSDECYHKWFSWAMLCIKLMKCIDAGRVRRTISRYRIALAERYRCNRFREGFNDVAWKEWHIGKFRVANNFNGEMSFEECYEAGRKSAYQRFYYRYGIEKIRSMVKDNPNVLSYGIPCYAFVDDSGEKTVESIDVKISQLSRMYRQYSAYYSAGWASVNQGEKPKNVHCHIAFLCRPGMTTDNVVAYAKAIGKNVALWQKAWSIEFVNLGLPTGCEKLIGYINNCVAMSILNPKNLDDVLHYDSSLIQNMVDECADSLRNVFETCGQYAVGASSLRQMGRRMIEPMKNHQIPAADVKRIFGIAYLKFGDYSCAYEVQKYYRQLGMSDDNRITFSNVCKSFLIPEYLLQNVDLYGRPDDIKNNCELAASLGKSEGLVYLSKYMLRRFQVSSEKAIREYEKHNTTLWRNPEFILDLRRHIEDSSKHISDFMRYCRCATKLNNANACYLFYEFLSGANGVLDSFIQLKRCFECCRQDPQDSTVIKIKTTFDFVSQKVNLSNDWVYLWKAANLGHRNAVNEWESKKSLYYKTYTDHRDGKEYRVVKLANSWWLAENLRYEAGATARNENECFYSLEDAKRAAFDGWRLPAVDEIDALNEFCAKRRVSSVPAGTSMKSKTWKNRYESSKVLDGTDEFGFNVEPNGMFRSDYNLFVRCDDALFWTESDDGVENACFASLSSTDNDLNLGSCNKLNALSVRLICDDPDFYND